MTRTYRRLARLFRRAISPDGGGFLVPGRLPEVWNFFQAPGAFRLDGLRGASAVALRAEGDHVRVAVISRAIFTEWRMPGSGWVVVANPFNSKLHYTSQVRIYNLEALGLPVDAEVLSVYVGHNSRAVGYQSTARLLGDAFVRPTKRFMSLMNDRQRQSFIKWLRLCQRSHFDGLPAVEIIHRYANDGVSGGWVRNVEVAIHIPSHYAYDGILRCRTDELMSYLAVAWWPRRCRHGMLGVKFFASDTADDSKGGYMLYTPNQGMPVVGPEMRAHEFAFDIKVVEGVPGIHACNPPIMLPKAGQVMRDPACLGRIIPPYYRRILFGPNNIMAAVALTIHSGHIVYGRCGLRSEYARILALAVPDNREHLVRHLQDRYGVPVGVFRVEES